MISMYGSLSLHFDGDISVDHKVTARTLAKSLTHTQNAIDRAYLDLKHGNLWKYARMSGEDYATADFIALYPREGGFIQEVASDVGQAILDRLMAALSPAVERVLHEGQDVATSLSQQLSDRKNQLERGYIEPTDFANLLAQPDPRVVRRYADRSINREFDQVLSIIRSAHAGTSSLEIEVRGTRNSTFAFDRSRSERFHSVVSQRQVGDPVVYVARVRQLDRRQLNGKVVNSVNEKTVTIHFGHDEDFLKVHPYLGTSDEMVFVGAPLVEYGAFDPGSGDVYFLNLV